VLGWFWCKRLPESSQAGLAPQIAGAGLLALGWGCVAASRDARAYALFLAFALLSCLCSLRMLRKPGVGVVLGYVISSALMVFSHYGAFAVLLAQNLMAIASLRLRPWLQWLPWLIVQLLLLVLALPLVPHLLQVRARMTGGPPRTLAVAGAHLSETALWLTGGVTLAIMLGVLTLWGLIRSRPPAGVKLGILGLIVLPVAIPLTSWYFDGPQYFPRHALAASLGLAGGAALGIAALPRWRNAVLGLVLAVAAGTLWTHRDGLRKPAMRQAAEYVARSAQPGDTVVVSLMMAGWSFDRYYPRTDTRRRNYDEFTVSQVVRGQPGMRRLWVVLNEHAIPEQKLIAESPMSIVSHARFYGIDVYELERVE
ncbi:MAG: hypothetical protein RMJ35_12555, partial [Phycisphaerales bacterium]|nr:hypothetical protein [Phycisphaerales bacterium]